MPDLHDSFAQFLLSNSLSFLGLIVAIFAIVISVWIYHRQKMKKEISYRVISDSPIVRINKNMEHRVKILLDGNEIDNARLMVLKMWNAGNIAIKKDDYEESVRFVFGQCNIVDSGVLETEPEDLIGPTNLQTFITPHTDYLEVPKILLNPKESISFSVLVSGKKGKVTARGRIVDGKLAEYSESNVSIFDFFIAVGLLIALIPVFINAFSNYYTIYSIILQMTVVISFFVFYTFRMRKLIHDRKFF